MKTRNCFENLSWLALIITSLAAGNSTFAGESSAGGADDYRLLPAFFTTYYGTPAATPVKTCLEVSKTFGIERPALEGMIQAAFKQWSDYIDEKNLNQLGPHDTRIRTGLDLVAKCDGTEELKFFFGVEDDEVRKFKNAFNRPFGFAALASEYPKPARGIVWIAPPRSICLDKENRPNYCLPNWSPATSDALGALVLHEVGHVFGNGHVDGTAMTSQIGLFLQNDTQLDRRESFVSHYSKIDADIDLILCLECAQHFASADRYDEIEHEERDLAHTFRVLTGESPVPPVTVEFERRSYTQGSGGYRYPGSGVLVVKDALKSHRIDVDVETQIGEHPDSTHLFEGLGGTFFTSTAVSFFGKFRPLNATEPQYIAISYNMDNVKTKILPLGGGLYTRPLFVSGN